MSFWYPWGANLLRNLCSKAVDIKKICNPSWGLRYWRSEFNYRWDIIIICFSILMLWTLCGKPMRGWQEALFYWFFFFWDALIVGGWGLRQNVLFRGNWNRIFLFLVFSLIGSAESRNAKEASRCLDFIDNCLIISYTRWPYLPGRWVHHLWRMLIESKVISFSFLVLIKGMRKWDESNIFLWNLRSG